MSEHDRAGALATVVGQIHAAPQRLVYIFAGAGSLALWQLHRVAGSSRTILEATDCYAPTALADLLGAAPAQAVSAATAREMAAAARRRALALAADGWPLLGVGCSAAIATDRARRGADRCELAVCGAAAGHSYTLMLGKWRDRAAQEQLIAELVIAAIARACGLVERLELELGPDEALATAPYTA
jgi:uncharacterized protein YfiM (DUF2279 family)